MFAALRHGGVFFFFLSFFLSFFLFFFPSAKIDKCQPFTKDAECPYYLSHQYTSITVLQDYKITSMTWHAIIAYLINPSIH